jgi:carboxymethylenebutenolidase
MATMTIKPYVHFVPVLTGEISYKNVYNFYKNHFIGKMSKNTKIIRISCTADKYQVVDDLILCFTDDTKIDFMLPEVPPAERYISFTCSGYEFEDDKITMNTSIESDITFSTNEAC